MIGPWLRSVVKIQPTTGRLVSAVGGTNCANWPALVGDAAEISWFR